MSQLPEPLKKAINNLPEFARAWVDHESALQEYRETIRDIRPVLEPRIFQIETTSACNLRCPFCPRTTDMVEAEKRGEPKRNLWENMPLDLFEKVLDQAPWLESVELHHFGDPFMQKNFHEYVKACKDRGIYTIAASNLLAGTPAKFFRTFHAGLNLLVMDIDSLDAEKYAKLRVNGRLELLKEKVQAILLLKHLTEGPYLAAQTIMFDGKPEYTKEELFAWIGREYPVEVLDEIRYKFVDSFRGEIADKGVLGPDDFCREPFYGMVIHADGNVVPCCRDWAGDAVMGNVKTQSVWDIWVGKKFEKFRKEMKSELKPEICRHCPEGKIINLRSQPKINLNLFRGEEIYYNEEGE